MEGRKIGALSLGKTYQMSNNMAAYLPDNVSSVFVGLGWSCSKDMDLDASCVLIDYNNKAKNCIYYREKSAQGISHSGDNRTGAGSGDDERINVQFNYIQKDIKYIYFTVNVYTGGTFSDIFDSYIRLVDVATNHPYLIYPLNKTLSSQGLVFIRIAREENNKWLVESLGWGCDGNVVTSPQTLDVVTGAQSPKFYQESYLTELVEIKPRCTNYDPDMEDIPVVLSSQQTCNLVGSSKAMLPSNTFKINVGLGWTLNGRLDLDASCVLFDDNFPNPNPLKIVNFNTPNADGVNHLGDNVTGEGDGDDEIIKIDLSKVHPGVASLWFMVNIFSEKGTFADVRDCRIRLFDDYSGHVFVNYKLNYLCSTNAFVFCKILRTPEHWAVMSLGWAVTGKTAGDPKTMDILRKIQQPSIVDAVADVDWSPPQKVKRNKNSNDTCCSIL